MCTIDRDLDMRWDFYMKMGPLYEDGDLYMKMGACHMKTSYLLVFLFFFLVFPFLSVVVLVCLSSSWVFVAP